MIPPMNPETDNKWLARQLLESVLNQRFQNGRIVEHWGGSNSLEALLELGLVQWVRPA
jgi:hypothetical protein